MARTLGCTVRELLTRIDSRELTEWLAYYGLNPWGPERADLNAGIVASTVANVMTTGGRFKPSDFMPEIKPAGQEPEAEPEAKTPEQLKDVLLRMTVMMGGSTIG